MYDFNERYPDEAPSSMAPWIEFPQRVPRHGDGDRHHTADVSVTGVYPDVASIYEPAVVTMEVSGRDILQVNYYVALIQRQNERVVLDYDVLV